MSFDSLPLEIVQLIFDWLPFRDLLSASLVCRSWYYASENPLTRRSWLAIHLDRTNDLTELAWNRRSHSNVLLTMVHSWEQLKPTMDICSEKVKLRRLSISRAWIDYVCQLFQLYADWLDRVEEVHISLDHRFFRNDTCSGKTYVIRLPTARCLHWSEIHIRRGNRTITVNGPRLKRVSISDSFASKLILILPDCDALESLECTLYRKNFTELYRASFEHLTTLILRIYYTVQNVKFLYYLPRLKWLTLLIEFEKELLEKLFVDTMDSITGCKLLEGLQLVLMGDTAPCSVDLNRLAESLPHLEQLELNNVYLSPGWKPSAFQRLTLLKLVNVDLREETTILAMHYPALRTISINAKLLSRISLQAGPRNKQLFVNVESLNLTEALDSYLNPFLKQFSNRIRELILFKPDCYDTVVDSSCPLSGLHNVERLHLINMAISLESLKIIAESNHLKVSERNLYCFKLWIRR